MGWKRGYFYASERSGGKVRSRYVGAGPEAEQAAAAIAARADARRALAAQRKAHRAEQAAIDEEYEGLRVLVTAHLLAQGLHQHRREWRKGRHA